MKTNLHSSVVAVIATAGLAFFLQSCTDSKGKNNTIPKGSEPIPVKVMALEQSNTSSVIITSGQLTTDDETLLSFKTGGVISSVLVKEGDQVKKGQLIATLDFTEINAQVSLARHNYEKAQRDFQRATNLYKDSVATLEQLQNSQTGLSVAKEQLDAANFNRNFSEIHAPANGYVLRKFVNAGQVVGVGDPVLMTNGASQSKWILKTGVSDKQWGAIEINDRAKVKIDAFPNQLFESRVIRKSEKADPQTGAFSVDIELLNAGSKLANGMFGSAELQSGEASTSWSVPYESVLDANGNEGFVFITLDNKTAIKQPVIIESFNGKTIRISKGLEKANVLIVAGSAYLADLSPIQIVK
ncbi:MAG TPA: efflux RND transporter periplasmic adaptor subunit [Cyclobacteriaceae bacterium]